MYRNADVRDPAGEAVDTSVFTEFLESDAQPAEGAEGGQGGDVKSPENGGDNPGDGNKKPAGKPEGEGADKTQAGKEGEGNEGADDSGGAGEGAGASDDVLPNLEDVDPEPEGTWIDVAETLGIEKPENPDDFEGFKANYEKKLVSEYERGKSEAVAADLSKFSPDARLFFDALNNGMKPADVIDVSRPFNDVLANPNDVLYKMYLMDYLGQSDAQADENIATLQETGTFDLEVAKVRTFLTQTRDAKVNELISNSAKAWDAEQKRILDSKNELNGKIKSVLEKKTEFLGGKLLDSHRQALLRTWENGTFESSLKNDPEAIVDFMLWRTFSKDRLAKLKENISNQTKLDVLKKQANVPDTGAGGAAAASKAKGGSASSDGDDDQFAGLKEAFGS